MAFAVAWRPADARSGDGSLVADQVAVPPVADRLPRMALTAHAGDGVLDEQIRAAQGRVREQLDVPRLERLAALFISKARTTGDPGFYKQASACAETIAALDDGDHAAALIQGHVCHALHDFAGAAAIAQRLADERGMFLDHGLLGDVRLDLGQFEAARTSYQRMLDLRPGLQSYARAAELRWRCGDRDGCRELLANAAAAGSNRAPESMAWVLARRAALELESDDAAAGLRYAAEALGFVADYPPALLVHGRAALALGHVEDAVRSLSAAAARYPLPEHLWGHAEALRAAGRTAAAVRVEERLQREGRREDPRALALWLAMLDRDAALANRLVDAELAQRQDPATLDVLAFARFRRGDLAGAQAAMDQALSAGGRPARFMFHAALIAEAAGDLTAARDHAAAATQAAAALWPSERKELVRLTARL